jgi:hypothetical protein
MTSMMLMMIILCMSNGSNPTKIALRIADYMPLCAHSSNNSPYSTCTSWYE